METIKIKPDFKKNMYEIEAWLKQQLICGVDEVGRGCFAGPVVAAAVILNPNINHKFLKDSKLLTSEERDKAFDWLLRRSQFGIGIISPKIIDEINIYNATLVAMKRAITQLLTKNIQKPSYILIDSMPVKFKDLDIPVICFNNGEKQSKSIAAASIIAKVTRDRLMQRIETIIPGYDFYNNKGYGTEKHRRLLYEIGHTFFHRNSFLSSYIKLDKDNSSSL